MSSINSIIHEIQYDRTQDPICHIYIYIILKLQFCSEKEMGKPDNNYCFRRHCITLCVNSKLQSSGAAAIKGHIHDHILVQLLLYNKKRTGWLLTNVCQ